MFLKVIRAEGIKLRRAPVWIAFCALTALSNAMGTFNYAQNLGTLTRGWYSLWTQVTLFGSFFFLPPLLGVLCAYQWRLEHSENNWNQLMTLPVPVWMLFGGKLAVAAGFSLLTMLAEGALFVLAGWLTGLRGALPPELPRWLMMGACAGICVCAVQLLLSMCIRSFAAPVGIALLGGVLGLAMSSMGLGLWCPYALMALGMNSNGRNMLALRQYGAFFAACAAFAALAWALAAWRLKRRDVVTREE